MQMIIGARGWEHKLWKDGFYETLLPDDWHLKYYSSKYGAALAPHNFWPNHSIEELEEFADDVPENYPLIFERVNYTSKNEKLLAKQDAAENLIGDWVNFDKDGWKKETEQYLIEQADIIKYKHLPEKAAVFRVKSSIALDNEAIKEIMLAIKTEFKEHDVVYVFFDGALVEIDIMDIGVTLLRMLVLL